MKKISFFIAFFTIFFTQLSIAENCLEIDEDPLFSKMVGRWVGKGYRYHSISKRKVDLEIHVDTRMINSKGIYSKNQIEEFTQENHQKKTLKRYDHHYWVLCESLEKYLLGVGDSFNRAEARSLGRYQNGVFEVIETIGGDSVVIKGKTDFISRNYSEFYQEFYLRGQLQSVTEIQFSQVAD